MTNPITRQRVRTYALAAILSLTLAFVAVVPAQAAPSQAVLLSIGKEFQLADRDGLVSDATSSQYLAGQTLYFPVFAKKVSVAAAYHEPVTEPMLLAEAELESFRVDMAVSQGAMWVDGRPVFVQMESASGGEQLYLALSLRDTYTNAPDQSLRAMITIQASNGCAVLGSDGQSVLANNRFTLQLDCPVQYGTTQVAFGGAQQIAYDQPLVSFTSEAKQTILCLDGGIELEGDFSQEGECFLRVTTTDTDLESNYPGAEIWKFEGTRKTFQQEVLVRIPAEMVEGSGGKPQAPYLYNLEQGLEPLQADYFAEEDAFIVSTQTPGCYLVSSNLL